MTRFLFDSQVIKCHLKSNSININYKKKKRNLILILTLDQFLMIIKMENYFIATHSYPYKCYDKIIFYPNNIFYKQTKKILYILFYL